MNRIGVLIIVLLTVISSSCLSRFRDIEINSRAEFEFPMIKGEYDLGDLFYNYDGVVVVDSGMFFNIIDTINDVSTSYDGLFDSMEIVFLSTNFIPFRIDMEFILLDSLEFIESYSIVLVESAFINEQLQIAMPVRNESSFVLDSTFIRHVDDWNRMVIHAKFIWPHETVAAKFDDEMKAFDLQVNLVVKL